MWLRGRGCRTEAVRQVIAAWQVTVVDPDWGRNDLLRPTLRRALEAHQEQTHVRAAGRGS